MEIITQIINLISSVVLFGGMLWALFGVVQLAGGLKNHNGGDINSGLWQIAGGLLIILAASLFKSVAIPTGAVIIFPF
ncbi:hypothetical protein [Turicibacter sanguinis]|uniref:hypothetical protein n=1 Tax=Turicibacter sanguinis TaxID=154288 RepID=UPI0021D4CA30|nr:hypothetical protein [Turicibacter sanguinis]MCU7197983.1 hypothetical protein [Turicibacter sanguinis]MDB8576088.1 hypothetical protein [Turicibacter sanguinis]MDB8578893.1 hypothetical protein [Turicibacter sanguinis]MDB8584706.1 hypothetical protein [Turicibacter sanguinis]MDB8587653.1 hypothetical protein [Turicibacter sanguinis]